MLADPVKHAGIPAESRSNGQYACGYDLAAAQGLFWDAFWGRRDFAEPIQLSTVELLASLPPEISASRSSQVVDLGCGNGRNLPALAVLNGVQEVIAIDQSQAALDRARSVTNQISPAVPLRFVQADCRDLPLDDESVDLVLASDILNHLPAPLVAIQEVKRVLRAGGIFMANPLSLNDPAYSRCQSRDAAIDDRTFLVSSDSSLSYLMHFAGREEVQSWLETSFDFIQPLTEDTRRDRPHAPPFSQVEHTHKYWRVICRKVSS